jgi:hypothetical protein
MLVFGLTPAEASQSRALLSPVIRFRVITFDLLWSGRYLLLLGVFFSYLYFARLNLRDPATVAYCKVHTIATIILLYRRIAKAIVSVSNLSQASVCGHFWERSETFWWDHQIYVQIGSSPNQPVAWWCHSSCEWNLFCWTCSYCYICGIVVSCVSTIILIILQREGQYRLLLLAVAHVFDFFW